MSQNKQVNIVIIITASANTNRGWLARLLAEDLQARGVARVDVSHVPMGDIESPSEAEKGLNLSEFAVFRMSEHQLSKQFNLDPGSGEPPVLCRPPVENRFGSGGVGIAVIGAANCGKSTIMKLMVECLNETPDTRCRALGISTIGDEPLPSVWMARANVPRLNEREVEVVFYVRKSVAHSSLEQILESCDKVQA